MQVKADSNCQSTPGEIFHEKPSVMEQVGKAIYHAADSRGRPLSGRPRLETCASTLARKDGCMTKAPGITNLLGLSLFAIGQNVPPPEVPANLKAAEGEEVILLARASGSQIYVCQIGSDQKFSWVLKAPDAELRDSQGALIGHHFAGPTWEHNDGSEVTGAIAAQQNAPDANSIPLLLVPAARHSGNGIFSRGTTIQRIHTKGGQPPNVPNCKESARAKECKSPKPATSNFN